MAAEKITVLIADAEVQDVKSGIQARFIFRVASYVMEASSEVALAVATILIALESPLSMSSLKYWAIGLNVGALSLRLLKAWSLRESRNRTQEVNIITKKLGVPDLPDIVIDQELLSTRALRVGSTPPRAPEVAEVIVRPVLRAPSAPPLDEQV